MEVNMTVVKPPFVTWLHRALAKNGGPIMHSDLLSSDVTTIAVGTAPAG